MKTRPTGYFIFCDCQLWCAVGRSFRVFLGRLFFVLVATRYAISATPQVQLTSTGQNDFCQSLIADLNVVVLCLFVCEYRQTNSVRGRGGGYGCGGLIKDIYNEIKHFKSCRSAVKRSCRCPWRASESYFWNVSQANSQFSQIHLWVPSRYNNTTQWNNRSNPIIIWVCIDERAASLMRFESRWATPATLVFVHQSGRENRKSRAPKARAGKFDFFPLPALILGNIRVKTEKNSILF